MRPAFLPSRARAWIVDLAMATLVIAVVSACALLGLEMHDA